MEDLGAGMGLEGMADVVVVGAVGVAVALRVVDADDLNGKNRLKEDAHSAAELAVVV